MHQSKGSFQNGKTQSQNEMMSSLGFLDLDHPAIELMWTPKATLLKLKNEDKHRYAVKILDRSKPAFDKKRMSRYWIEYLGKKKLALA